jgi:hypothetical protein
MKRTEFIKELESKLREIESSLKLFQAEDEALLSEHPAEGKWSVLECIEHLHRYNEFYLPEFRKSLSKARTTSDTSMKRGSFGMKSAKSMLPGESGVRNPMKTFKSKNSLNSGVSKAVLKVFKREQEELMELVKSAYNRDIGGVKCETTLPIIRFRLCDALEFVINHQLRHIAQANRVQESVSIARLNPHR